MFFVAYSYLVYKCFILGLYASVNNFCVCSPRMWFLDNKKTWTKTSSTLIEVSPNTICNHTRVKAHACRQTRALTFYSWLLFLNLAIFDKQEYKANASLFYYNMSSFYLCFIGIIFLFIMQIYEVFTI